MITNIQLEKTNPKLMLVRELLFLWLVPICLFAGLILQIIAYDFMDNKPLFFLGTVFSGSGVIFTIVNLVKSLRNFRKKKKASEKRKS